MPSLATGGGQPGWGVRIRNKIVPTRAAQGQAKQAQTAPEQPANEKEPFDPIEAVRQNPDEFIQICLDNIARYDFAKAVISVMKMFGYDNVPETANGREELYQQIAQYGALRSTGLKREQALAVIKGALSDEPITDVAKIPFDMPGEAVPE